MDGSKLEGLKMTEKYRVEKIKLATERQRWMKKETV